MLSPGIKYSTHDLICEVNHFSQPVKLLREPKSVIDVSASFSNRF